MFRNCVLFLAKKGWVIASHAASYQPSTHQIMEHFYEPSAVIRYEISEPRNIENQHKPKDHTE